ncbi:MAG: 3-methyl-2-oxobutanoate hydroxymethyltransferase [Pseudanabaenaceae cyanobacterium SKYGB_i_bin29]|nr:3-methyl-2-oxobutanoate hydroxymethyltransferase [Pseudanabaenaceae cyanobacterium SKYG29]MDW8420980.1 3-methyl-2-oxobutanoate hydroxymethyltransferase [Pseudanabaenaceae cyanobacterium SKYGB_i_bin29]
MPLSIAQLSARKKQKQPIVALTAWEYATAQIIDRAGIDVILVGDSLGMVALGYRNTLPVTLDEIIHHAKAVGRGVEQALLVVDLPFMTYQVSPSQALRSAGRVLKETPAQGVKLEGGYPEMVATVAKLVRSGIPVMGHVGLTPQSVYVMGYRQQGAAPEVADRIYQEALALEKAGVFALILEHIPSELAQKITETVTVPTIGIGAGPHCDGQILVTHDLLGLSAEPPPFAPKYTDLRQIITEAVTQFSQDVRNHRFPGMPQS